MNKEIEQLLYIGDNLITEINIMILFVDKLKFRVKDNELLKELSEVYYDLLIYNFDYLDELQDEVDLYAGKNSTRFDKNEIIRKCLRSLK